MNKFDENRNLEDQDNMEEQVIAQQQQIQAMMETIRNLQAQIQAQAQMQAQAQAQVPAPTSSPANTTPTEAVYRNIKYMSTFTGKGDVSVNSFISNVEYQLSTTNDVCIKQAMVRAIFYEKIQGEAKNCIINIPDPSDWDRIKVTLKLRYKPELEPSEIYKRIANLKVNSVSELATIIQDIKYKADEIQVYYRGQDHIDLSNVDSLLVNTIKEMTQGVLLDKIYYEKELGNIIVIMRDRRFEDTCIRKEYNKNINYQKHYSQNKNLNRNSACNNDLSNQNRSNNNKGQFQQNNYSNNNNSRPYRSNDNFYKNNNNSGNFRHNQQGSGNFRNNSGQYRHQQNFPKQRPVDPNAMEVENIQIKEHKINRNENNNIDFFIN